jgi:hypothetical protein
LQSFDERTVDLSTYAFSARLTGMPGSRDDIPVFPRLDGGEVERTEIDQELRFTLRIGQKPWFLVVGGRQCLGMLIEVRDKMTIGRSAPADVILDEEGISRRHALVEVVHGGVVRITDLGSKNGVRVGGRRTKLQALRDGERVRLGDAVLTLVHFEDNVQLLAKNLQSSLETLTKRV